MINLPACFRLRRVFALLVALGCATAAHAGHFSTTPWMNDASTYIVGGQSSWAYHFGSATTATVNGGSVAGVVGPTATNANFALTGTQFVFSDVNNLTALGGTGSAVIASNFVFGGAPATITVKNLTPGSPYTVSILSVGFEGPGVRLVTFASGTDSRLVDQDQFGDNNSIRVDYTFTATATNRVITVAVANTNGATFHLYGLALRPETPLTLTTVANTNDSGAGSVRWALANAADLAGSNTITFAPALSGQTITLASEIVLADTNGSFSAQLICAASGNGEPRAKRGLLPVL